MTKNPHLPLPQLLWPDLAAPANIYDPTTWADADRHIDPTGNGETPQWIATIANQLAPQMESTQEDALMNPAQDLRTPS